MTTTINKIYNDCDNAIKAIKNNNNWYLLPIDVTNKNKEPINLYIKKHKDKIIISDNNIVIKHIKLNTSLINRILSTYNIQLKDNCLYVECKQPNFTNRVFNFILAITDLIDLCVQKVVVHK